MATTPKKSVDCRFVTGGRQEVRPTHLLNIEDQGTGIFCLPRKRFNIEKKLKLGVFIGRFGQVRGIFSRFTP